MPHPTRLIAFFCLLSLIVLAFAWSAEAHVSEGCKKCLETYRDGKKESIAKGCAGKRYSITASHAQKHVSCANGLRGRKGRMQDGMEDGFCRMSGGLKTR